MILISDNNASIVGDPAEGALNCISSPVAIPQSVIFSIDVAMVFSMWNKKIDSSLPQTFASRIAVLGLVSDYSLWSGPGYPGPRFGTRISPITLSRRVISAGEALSVWLPRGTPLPSTNYQALRCLSPLGFSHTRALFLLERSWHPQTLHPNPGCHCGPTLRERHATCPGERRPHTILSGHASTLKDLDNDPGDLSSWRQSLISIYPLEHQTVVRSGATSFRSWRRLGNERFDLLPLLIGQVHDAFAHRTYLR